MSDHTIVYIRVVKIFVDHIKNYVRHFDWLVHTLSLIIYFNWVAFFPLSSLSPSFFLYLLPSLLFFFLILFLYLFFPPFSFPPSLFLTQNFQRNKQTYGWPKGLIFTNNWMGKGDQRSPGTQFFGLKNYLHEARSIMLVHYAFYVYDISPLIHLALLDARAIFY